MSSWPYSSRDQTGSRKLKMKLFFFYLIPSVHMGFNRSMSGHGSRHWPASARGKHPHTWLSCRFSAAGPEGSFEFSPGEDRYTSG